MDVFFSNLKQILDPRPSTSIESKFADVLDYPVLTICNMAINVELSHI